MYTASVHVHVHVITCIHMYIYVQYAFVVPYLHSFLHSRFGLPSLSCITVSLSAVLPFLNLPSFLPFPVLFAKFSITVHTLSLPPPPSLSRLECCTTLRVMWKMESWSCLKALLSLSSTRWGGRGEETCVLFNYDH